MFDQESEIEQSSAILILYDRFCALEYNTAADTFARACAL